MKYKFQRGDLVKNKKSITWRNQDALGIIIEDVGMFSGRQLVRIKWIKSNLPEKTKNWSEPNYYANSLDLVASVSK